MGRKPLPSNKKRNKAIRILLNETELYKYHIARERLSIHSPTLSVSKIFRFIAQNIDDRALIMFLNLDKNDPIRTKLLNDFKFKDFQ